MPESQLARLRRERHCYAASNIIFPPLLFPLSRPVTPPVVFYTPSALYPVPSDGLLVQYPAAFAVRFAPGMLRLKLLNFASVLLPDALQLCRMARSGLSQFILGHINPLLQLRLLLAVLFCGLFSCLLRFTKLFLCLGQTFPQLSQFDGLRLLFSAAVIQRSQCGAVFIPKGIQSFFQIVNGLCGGGLYRLFTRSAGNPAARVTSATRRSAALTALSFSPVTNWLIRSASADDMALTSSATSTGSSATGSAVTIFLRRKIVIPHLLKPPRITVANAVTQGEPGDVPALSLEFRGRVNNLLWFKGCRTHEPFPVLVDVHALHTTN